MEHDPQSRHWARSIVILLVLTLVTTVTLVAWRLAHEEDAASTKRGGGNNDPVPVLTTALSIGPISQHLEIGGSLESPSHIIIKAEVAGQLRTMPWRLGDQLRSGDVIATIDDTPYQLVYQQMQAELAVAEAELAEANSVVAVRQRQAQRLQRLVNQQAASADDLDQAEAQRLSAEAAVAVAEARVSLAHSAVANAAIDVDKCRIVVPEGLADPVVVGQQALDPGSHVENGDVVIELIQLQSLLAVIMVSEQQFGQFKLGQSVTLHCDAWPEQNFTATVSRFAPMFQSGSRQLRVELAVENPDLLLRPGMFIEAQVEIAHQAEAIRVPVSAILGRQSQPHLFVINQVDGNSVAHKWDVTLGLRQGDWVAVAAEGFAPSDGAMVVVLGQHLLSDGTVVSASEQSTAARAGEP